jgi:hypothetical protein
MLTQDTPFSKTGFSRTLGSSEFGHCSSGTMSSCPVRFATYQVTAIRLSILTWPDGNTLGDLNEAAGAAADGQPGNS